MNVSNSLIQLRPLALLRRLTLLLSALVPSLKPRFQTALARFLYWGISFGLKNDDSAFLNYGYAPLDAGAAKLRLDPDDEPDRFSIQLYARVAGARDLRGKNVLEIGCGRGGGTSFIARYLHPASMTGVDLSARAIRVCRRRHRTDRLKFQQGDAEHLPFPSGSFDAVVNVESSHCYPSFERFVAEVARVLRPGGMLLFADLRKSEEMAAIRAQLKERLTILEEEFLTANVVRALELDSNRRNLLIQERAPRLLQKGVRLFAAVSGSPIFDALAAGSWQYVRFVLQRPDTDH